jgi:hypothetical protein
LDYYLQEFVACDSWGSGTLIPHWVLWPLGPLVG